MKYNIYISLTVTILLGIVIFSCYPVKKRPNVIIISVSGSPSGSIVNNNPPTAINNIFSEGVLFNRFYKSSTFPQNDDYSIITGQYYCNPNISLGLKHNDSCFARILSTLKSNKYKVGSIGNWHLNDTLKSSFNEIIEADQNDNSYLVESTSELIKKYQNDAFFFLINLDYKKNSYSIDFDNKLATLLGVLHEVDILDNTIISLSYSNGSSHNLTVKEKDINVPTAIMWQDKIEGGRSNNFLVSSVDIMPTIFDLLKIENKKTIDFDGVSWASHLIYGETLQREALVIKNASIGLVITNNWKYIHTENLSKNDNLKQKQKDPIKSEVVAQTNEQTNLLSNNMITDELYNLDTDPSEQNNLATEVRFRSKLAEMKKRLLTCK